MKLEKEIDDVHLSFDIKINEKIKLKYTHSYEMKLT